MKTSVARSAKASKVKKSRPDYSVPALDKGLDVFELLAASETSLSLTGIAGALGQAPSAVFRILNRLENRSYVMRHPVSGQYRLSLKLFELAHTHSPVEHLITVSGKPMRELADSVRQSVHLSALSGGHIVVLLNVGSPLRVRFTHEIGGQFSSVLTNSGRLLLAYLLPEALEDHLAKDPDYAQLSATEREVFHEELKKIRRNRYALSSSEELAGMKDIAVLVGNPAIGATAALAIAFLSGGKNGADINLLVSELQESAARITKDLGVSYDRDSSL
ncbi:MAG: IclR family transcriptional regulator [Acidobacteriaceae bacterium]